MRKVIGITLLLFSGAAANAYSQEIQIGPQIPFGATASPNSQEMQINRQNRTVDVTVTASVSKFADLAEVRFSCDTKSQTHEQAYQKNVEKADKVVKALLDAGVLKDDIVTAGISLDEEERTAEEIRANPKRTPSFEAVQTWTVRVAASDAQKVIDAAVQAGADSIGEVKWMLSNPDATVAEARIAAVKKARANATEIANGLGVKLGDVIFVSNVAIATTLVERREMTANVMGNGGKQVSLPNQKLQLFPERIEKQATVRVVFALD